MKGSIRAATGALDVRELGVVDYHRAWELQRALADRRGRAGPGEVGDALLLLEHPAVYTAGRRTEAHERPVDPDIAVIDTDRGGKITWHGPGQLVGYPIVRLADPIDVVDFVRRLEDALMTVCRQFGVTTVRVPGRSGVWVPARDDRPARKIAAIGVRVARAVTLHGFALNCDCDLRAYADIVPCGIADAGVTSLSAELGRAVTVAAVRRAVAEAVGGALDGTAAGSRDGATDTGPAPRVALTS